MIVTATDFKINLGRYLSSVNEETITISKNGKPVAKLVPYKEYVTDSLVGIFHDVDLPEDFDGDYRKMISEMRGVDYEDLD